MIARSWEDCRREWEASETRLLLNPEQIAARWADGRCGQCGNTYDDHQPLPVVPLRPVHPLVVGYLKGEAILSRLNPADLDLLRDLVHLIPDDHTRAEEMAGGAR